MQHHLQPAWNVHGSQAVLLRHSPWPTHETYVRKDARHAADHENAQAEEDVRDVSTWPRTTAAHGATAGFLGMPTLGNPCTSQEAVESLADRFHPRCDIFPSLVPKHLDASLTVSKPILAPKGNTIADPQELDAPIDLSKKCSPLPDKSCNSPKRLLDYHECTVCKISFNKVENYLAHKQNFCPFTSAQHGEIGSLEQPMFPSVKSEGNNSEDIYDKSSVKCEKNGGNKLMVQNGGMFPPHLGPAPDLKAFGDASLMTSKDENNSMFLPHCLYPGAIKKVKGTEPISPYFGIKSSDYMAGSLVMQGEAAEQEQSSNGAGETGTEPPAANGCPHPGKEPLPLLPKNRGMVIVNGGHKEDRQTPATPQQENQPHNTSSPEEQTSPTWGAENPPDPNENASPTSKSPVEESAPAGKGINGSAPPAGSGKYCRLCDIQFNNLSNFITHKKFYCSSHAAEHVKWNSLFSPRLFWVHGRVWNSASCSFIYCLWTIKRSFFFRYLKT